MNDHAAGTEERVVAQTGEDAGDRWHHLNARPTMTPAEFSANAAAARIIVGHAGIGTILSAMRHAKPLVILPRKASLREHRNDHQIATARQIAGREGLHVVWESDSLTQVLGQADLGAMREQDIQSRCDFISRLSQILSG